MRKVLVISFTAVAWVAAMGAPAQRGDGDVPVVTHVDHAERLIDKQIPISREQQLRSVRAIVVRGMHQSIQVNVDGAGDNIVGDAANEPTIAIDPTDPNNIVIGWRQFDTIASNFRQAGYAYSHDGGQNWTFPGVLDPGQFRSDPVLAADNAGDFYYYTLSSVTTAEYFVSTDRGVNWIGPISSPGGDKIWHTIDVSGGLGDGHIYGTWNTNYTCCRPNTDFTRSTDSATSFEGPYKLPRHPKWGTADVGPDGELYIVGTNLSGVGHLFLRSDDAKDAAETPSFPTLDSIELGGDIAVGATPNPGGLLGQDWVAVDRSTGSTRGNVYVLASVDPPGADPLDVHLIRSEDGGQTWSAPLRVNDDPTDNGAYQWFGTMSVSPQGRIDVIWNDTRNDASGTTSEVFYAYSTDAGDTWSAGLPVSPPWNSLIGYPNQNKIGDYYHMISDAEGAGLAYSATFNGEQDVYFLRVGDCNVNGQHDSTDIATQFSGDCNENGIADECEENLACTSCSIDADCDDGVFCNGTELCLAGLCNAGTPVDCDDGVACTQDSCNLAADVCENFTDDALCDNGLFCDGDETCNPTSGCQPGADPCPDPDDACLEDDDTCCTVEVEICNDAVDNDCDGSADCLDGDCAGSPACACDNDGNCEAGEDCETCSNDCVSGLQSCGNGVCEPSLGEDCVSCGEDCNGKQNGKPQNRFCCGDGDGSNPLGCSAPVCSSSGFSCSDVPVPSSCCGDGACEVGEDSCSCGIDCGFPSGSESVCDDGIDDDCDGTIDCEDQECAGDPVCAGCVPTSSKEKGPRCTDGVDNDCDGLIDAADPDC